MKKFALFLAPLMAISFLTNCGGKSEPKQYSVTVTSEDISKGTVSGGGTFAYNSDVTITAVANTGYRFAGWYDSETHISDESTYNFKMPTNDIAYTAKFIAIQYILTVTSEDTSKGTVSGGGSCDYGSSVTINATPNNGYSFEGWYKDGSKVESSNPYTLTMPANDVSYEARFTANQFTLTVTSEDESRGTVYGGGKYAYNSDVTITAITNKGYKFVGWYDGKTRVSVDSTYNFKMLAKNITYTAKFYVATGPWYQREDWWNYCSNGVAGEQATKEDIGKEVNLTVNDQVHRIRLIDIEHDDLINSEGQAHCTFEFTNLLSDENGYSLATLWNTKDGEDSKNYDYLNSDLRRALDGQGTGTLRWYQKNSEAKSTSYTTSVLDMLPGELKDNIKTVNKTIATGTSYTPTNYAAKVFVLTYNEMTQTEFPYVGEEGKVYQYHKDHDDDSSRIKKQVKGYVGSGNVTEITDLNYPNAANYAGYNHSESDGCNYWLTSPYTIYDKNISCSITKDGKMEKSYVCYYAYPVAPAFCI